MAPPNVPSALRTALAADPSRPLLTYLYADGARTELSVRTFENNVAKTANLLRDDADLQPGSHVAVDLPAHWQTAVWIGACAQLGAVAWQHGPADDPEVAVAVLDPLSPGDARADVTLLASRHPFGLPNAGVLPPGVLDAASEVRLHGDVFTPYVAVDGAAPWLRLGDRTWTQAEALAEAERLAASVGLEVGGRLLCARGDGPEALLVLLAVPLALDASVVLVEDPDADLSAVAASERCTAVLAG